MIALAVLASLPIGAAVKHKGYVNCFYDTCKADSVKTIAMVTYEGCDNTYGTQYGGRPLFSPLNTKFFYVVDTLAAETADSVSYALKYQWKNNRLGYWSTIATLTTLTADSLYLVRCADIPAGLADAWTYIDSLKFTVDATDGDPTGNFVKWFIGYGEQGD